MAARQQVADALKVAIARGDQNDARKLQAWLNSLPTSGPEIPSMADMPGAMIAAPAAPVPERTPTTLRQDVGNAAATVGQQAVGAGETALAVGTGAIPGTVAGTGAFLKGVADSILRGDFGTQQAGETIARSQEAASQAVTYAPRTDAGQQQTAAVGKVAPALEPLIGMAPELGMLGEIASAPGALRAAAEPIVGAARPLVDAAHAALSRGSDAVSAFMGRAPKPSAGAKSVGAAAVTPEQLRKAGAESIGFKDDSALTKAQVTQDDADKGFEIETAKNEALGGALRERADNQQAQVTHTFDNFIEQTEGSVPDFSGGGKHNLGRGVEDALAGGMKKQREQVKTAYATADKHEGSSLSTLDNLAAYILKNDAKKGTAGSIGAVEKEGLRLGIFTRDEDGALVAQPAPIRDVNELRTFITDVTKQERPDMRAAQGMKAAIDEKMLADGGPLYKQATRLSAQFKGQYENAGLIADLLKTEHGAPDRAIAAEHVLERTVFAPSVGLDELKHVRRLLQAHGGEAGAQAWKDLQAGTLEQMRSVATRAGKTTAAGDAKYSAAQLHKVVQQLDSSGKLDWMFGENGADKIRTLDETVRSINIQGGNPSGTASAIQNAIDHLPVVGPAARILKAVGSAARTAKTKSRIKEHLR